MKTITLLASAIALTVVAAQSDEGRLYYTEPTGATVWTSGKKHTVSWSNVCNEKNKSKLAVVLYKGVGEKGGTEQVRVPGLDSIGYVDCLKNKEATVTIPAGLTSGDNYSIHVDTVPLQSYSAQFTIKGVDPAPSTPAPGAPGTPGTPGTPGVPGAPGTPGNGTVPSTAPGITTGTATATVPATTTTSSAGLAPSNPADTENAAGSLKAFGSTAALAVAAVGAYFF